MSDEKLSTASTDLRLGCPDVEKIIVDRGDLSTEAMKGENLETDELQTNKTQATRSQIDKLQSA